MRPKLMLDSRPLDFPHRLDPRAHLNPYVYGPSREHGEEYRLTAVIGEGVGQKILAMEWRIPAYYPEQAKRYELARFLREFADGLERGSEETDAQRADRLQKQLDEVRKVAAVR